MRDVKQWAEERLANTLRIADLPNHAEDKAGWLEDAAFWREIVAALDAHDVWREKWCDLKTVEGRQASEIVRLSETIAVYEPAARNWPTLLKQHERLEQALSVAEQERDRLLEALRHIVDATAYVTDLDADYVVATLDMHGVEIRALRAALAATAPAKETP